VFSRKRRRPVAFSPEDPEAQAVIAKLFERWPVLVEVYFPRSGTTPDWYLFRDREELDQLLERLATNVEINLTSVWSLGDDNVNLKLKRGDA
jgi:hypothetical protein